MLASSLQSHEGNARLQTTRTMTKTLTTPSAPTCDIKHKFVRIRQIRPDGLVCFEFAIGWPELFVDLMLPQPAFDDFCVQNQVQLLKS